MDKWHGLTMQDIRDMEIRLKQELDEKMAILGHKTDDGDQKAESIKSTPF